MEAGNELARNELADCNQVLRWVLTALTHAAGDEAIEANGQLTDKQKREIRIEQCSSMRNRVPSRVHSCLADKFTGDAIEALLREDATHLLKAIAELNVVVQI
jgi:hypothetical protein